MTCGWCSCDAPASWDAVAYSPAIWNPGTPASTDCNPIWSTGSSAKASTLNGECLTGGREFLLFAAPRWSNYDSILVLETAYYRFYREGRTAYKQNLRSKLLRVP